MNYYVYNPGGSDRGPFTLDQLKAKLASRAYSSEEKIRVGDSDDYVPLSEILNETSSQEDSALPTGDNRSKAVTRRYRNAYLVARTTNGIGGAVKAIGFVLGGIVALAGAFIGSQGGSSNPIFMIGGLIAGAVVAIPLFVLGVLVSAQGQVLKAALDEAVHTSPFLTDDPRASVMSLQ